MKKTTLALTLLLSLGLTACSTVKKEGSYRGEVLLSAYQGKDLTLTIRKNDCEKPNGPVELLTVTHNYDSNIVVGACVEVSDNGQSITNVSRTKSRAWIARSGHF